MTETRRSEVLRASEIGNYAYCARGWWLSRALGYPSAHKDKMILGEEEHRSHGRAVVFDHRLERLGYLMIALGVLVGLLALSWWLATSLLR